jgi:hypothetical protein
MDFPLLKWLMEKGFGIVISNLKERRKEKRKCTQIAQSS